MYDRLSILNLVEDAERELRFCACGAHMVVVARDGALWYECAGRQEPRVGFLARLASLDWLTGHDRRLLLEAPDESLAA
jgi:hypothetical protein